MRRLTDLLCFVGIALVLRILWRDGPKPYRPVAYGDHGYGEPPMMEPPEEYLIGCEAGEGKSWRPVLLEYYGEALGDNPMERRIHLN